MTNTTSMVAMTGETPEQHREATVRFAALYHGLKRAFGVYQNGRAKTLRQEVTLDHFDRHLNGEYGIGIIPIDEDNMCRFGVIDIDEDTIDHMELLRKVTFFKFPLIVCRSKSGGAHLYTFMKKPAPARVVRKVLSKWAAELGYGASEIFPKQNALEKSGVGNWINLPYFNIIGEDCIRFAYDDVGPMVFLKFLTAAENLAEYNDIEVYDDSTLEPDGMPPCLSYFFHSGAGEGSRNEVLYSMGVFAKKSDRPDLEDFLYQMNFKMIDPPLPTREIKTLLNSLRLKNYQYKCKHPLFKQHCNPEVCKKLKYGIVPQGEKDTSYDEHMIGCLTKYTTNPVRWEIDINGITVEFNSDELMDYRKIRCLSMERANIIAPPMKQEEWLLVLKERLEHVRIVECPEDANADGDMAQVLSEFIQIAERGQQGREDLLRGIPVKDTVTVQGEVIPVILFRSQDFLLYLKRRKISLNVTGNLLWMKMRAIGVGHTKIRVKGNTVLQTWYVPMNPEYTTMEPITPELEI